MRIIIYLVLISVSFFPKANVALDADNEGEAVGILFSYLKEIDVHTFMCSKYVPEIKDAISEATDDWMLRNHTIVSNLFSGLERTPENEVEELLKIAKDTSRARIVIFTNSNKTEQEGICSKMIGDLKNDTFNKKYPLTIDYLKK